MTATDTVPTVADLMSRTVKMISADMSLRDAAEQLVHYGVRGVPVVDADGRCVGVLSVSDLARWASGGRDRSGQARTCRFQDRVREPGGRETVVCQLADGVCPFQVRRATEAGSVLACAEPNCVPTDWQMVQLEALPTEMVRDFMTTTVVSVGPEAPMPELARTMLDRGVHRVFVLDAGRRPVGVVAVDDLLQVIAHPELFVPR
jgi:CBS domain-containing protein